ncbi:MAG: adenylyltransferase/cytidyltransferase family protein [Candidatus Diapherotrites archaeon]|jgi:FAD synthetase|uniref:Adenylyltransferase/cytidyltransferase family protein n=1 Tax=Candidatus Iainarchaeum sp. TaxID=3101447 RepID=A0A8T5GF79_9ARCH|nr:adenylyltransferase/cytidyltransferase family protein [Candidatus Diapherotrites archaeon]MBT7241430.1 adenylyltransferase/cytidyltransferase family protein [Candidatus Diapherotrites archaeon]
MGKKINVVAVGTFDVIHLGHINYLKQAKALGDKLIVVVSSDAQCKKRGKEPYFSERERKQMVEELNVVDEVIVGHQEDIFKVINELKPSIICIGHDSHISEEVINENLENGNKPKIVRAKALHTDKYNTTKIKKNYL